MRIQKEKCDECGLEVEDYCVHLGWIKIRISLMSISKGRGKKGDTKTSLVSNEMLDFCSKECHNAYFAKLFKVKEKKNASKTNSRSKNKKVASKDKAS